MRKTTLTVVLLAAFATGSGVLAHEGHRHDAMGTVEAIDAEQLALAVSEDETLTFALTEETSYVRADEAVPREDVVAGERAVVTYQKKDGVDVAVEVKLAARPE